MHDGTTQQRRRRPRFRRSPEPLAFRLTDDDVAMVRLLARHRFLRSTHIAALVGRSLDRTNDRLLRLFHAGYVDRPRAQLDHYPTAGSAPMVYGLAELGAVLLSESDGVALKHIEWDRKNSEAGRPFIEHQLEVVDFYVSIQIAARGRPGVRFIDSEELIAAFPERTRAMRNPLAMRASVSHGDENNEIGLVPDAIFGLMFPDLSRRCFMVEIDRGTMPVNRSTLAQSSFARKMRAYLAAYADKLHERQFGWKAFRVLVVTTSSERRQSMMEALRQLDEAQMAPGPTLFYFALREDVRQSGPLTLGWHDGAGREVKLI